MRTIGTLPKTLDPRPLVRQLLSSGIEVRLEQAGDTWQVWALDEDRLEEAKTVLHAWLADPDDPRFTPSGPSWRSSPDAAAERTALAGPNADQPLPTRRRRGLWAFPLTPFLIGLSVTVAVLTDWGRDQMSPLLDGLLYESLHRVAGRGEQAQVVLAEIRAGQLWRLFTPMFVHFGPIHLIVNMMSLWSLGLSVEQHLKLWRSIALVVALALLSNLAQFAWTEWGRFALFGERPGLSVFGGMSGVILGLFGFIWARSWDRSSGLYMPPGEVVWMLVFMGLCYAGFLGPIANAAHTAGLVTGLVIGIVPMLWKPRRR